MFGDTAKLGIRTGIRKLPQRILIYGKPGVGKSSFGAYAPKPVFSTTKSEDGVHTLIAAGLVPEDTAYFPAADNWAKLREQVEYMIQNDTGYKTYVIDTINGAEKMCHDHICDAQFNGSLEKFTSFGRGVDQSRIEWEDFFQDLDRLRESRGVRIILVAHSKLKRINNPEGEDYDKYVVDCSEKGYNALARWADMILFLHRETSVSKEHNKRKSSLGSRRIYTEDQAAFDAKNRLGLPGWIDVSEDPSNTWGAFVLAATEAAQANAKFFHPEAKKEETKKEF